MVLLEEAVVRSVFPHRPHWSSLWSKCSTRTQGVLNQNPLRYTWGHLSPSGMTLTCTAVAHGIFYDPHAWTARPYNCPQTPPAQSVFSNFPQPWEF